MKILVISNNYPSETAPSNGVFVYKLLQQFAKLGHEINVITPTGISWLRKFQKKQSYGNELCTVHRPKYISASAKNIFGFNTYRIGEWGQINAVKNTVKKNNIEFDVIYAHFLSNTFVAVKALGSYNKPIYAAVGEYRNIEVRKAYYSPKTYMQLLSGITGFIAVSPQIKEKLMSFSIRDQRIIVKPNGVDFNKFFKRDKVEMRKKHNLPLNKKLIVFVGRFIHNKGPIRLLEATSGMEEVGLIFIGSGIQELESDLIVFKNKLPSEMVPEYLSSADLFVMPTQHEGSSNAIVEAMACGLPIVSSDIPEIRVQCNPSFSILVDPLDVTAIKNAVKKILFDDEKQDEMSKKALEHAKQFDIQERAQSIISFINPKVENRIKAIQE